MNREIKYIAESVFFIGFLFILYQGYLAVAGLIISYVGLVLICTIVVCIPTFAGILMYHVHHSFLEGKAPKKGRK